MSIKGPYKVGILDCRLPTTHTPTIRLRVYYPTETTTTPAPWLPPYPSPSDQCHSILTSFLSFPRPLAPFLRPLLTPLTQQALPAFDAPPILATPNLPPVLFSHGLGGSTGGYSHFCIDLASHGRVVFAPEHSDGSAFVAYVGDTASRLSYMKYNPAVHGPTDRVLRNRQLEIRLGDCRRVIDCITSGKRMVPLNRAHTSPNFRVDMSQLVITGHSFGGATALLLAGELRPSKLICLDAWLQPVERIHSLDLGDTLCLFVDMGNGMKGSVKKREELCRPSGEGFIDAVRIVDGLHNNSSDFPFRLPKLLAVAGGMTRRGSDPGKILDLQSQVVERFLSGVQEWRGFREALGEDGDVVVAPVGRGRSGSRFR